MPPISITMTVIGLIATVFVLVGAIRSYRSVRHTSLTNAWGWGVIASLTCVGAGLIEILRLNSPMVAQAWYFAAVVGLCPGIAVLGSRRPTVRVWNWFVILPLIAVLSWPVALCWMPRGPVRPPMEVPAMWGFMIVGVMSFGNYLGTRHTLLCIALGIADLKAFFSAIDPKLPDHVAGRTGGLIVAAIAVAVSLALRRKKSADVGWNQTWSDFRSLFGLVWAYRLAERVNQQAAREEWPVRLGRSGFFNVSDGALVSVPADEARVNHTLRWLLRRFVDDTWIDARVGRAATGTNEKDEALAF
jgi:hypothetical protein